MANILIVEPSRGIRVTLKEKLEAEGHKVWAADTPQGAIKLRTTLPFDVEICGHNAPREHRQSPWIQISADNTNAAEQEAFSQGAYDFIPKPINWVRMFSTIGRIVEGDPVHKNVQERVSNVSERLETYEIIGTSSPVKHLLQAIERIAPTSARVLIMGENGTGKELVARQIHERSERWNAPFIEVNCAAIPSELIESELFGHEKGSFTSAYRSRTGKFEQANGGTLFLDEIGDMPLAAQAKVLRVLQESSITRVGSDHSIAVNVRVIAATNKNLRNEINERRFREDLYHRLSVIVLKVPTLAERSDDIPLLTHYFLLKIAAEYGIPTKGLTGEAVAELRRLPWSGNIRELRNVCERLLILAPSDTITLQDVETYATANVL